MKNNVVVETTIENMTQNNLPNFVVIVPENEEEEKLMVSNNIVGIVQFTDEDIVIIYKKIEIHENKIDIEYQAIDNKGKNIQTTEKLDTLVGDIVIYLIGKNFQESKNNKEDE